MSSNWLDRLRLSRGFPTGEEPDLNRFISSSSSGSVPTNESTRSESTQHQTPILNHTTIDQHVSNVLCELFIMGGSQESSRTFSRSCRKQKNPRFVNSDSSENKNTDRSDTGVKVSVQIDDGGGDDYDMEVYTKSDVLVIDTSLKDWKFDGWVYRNCNKNDEWKVKEKIKSIKSKSNLKSKMISFEGNKKIKSFHDLEGKDIDELKKVKKNKDDGKNILLEFNIGHCQNDRKEEPFKDGAGFQTKVSQNRFPCPRPPEKPGNESSSVVLLKSIPLNSSNVNATKLLGKSSRKRPPKKMKIV